MKKIKSILSTFTLLLLITFAGSFVHATSEPQNQEEVLIKAFEFLLKGDIEQYANYVIDDRFVTKKDAISLYKSRIDYNPLINFEIVNEQKIDSNLYRYTIRNEYESGSTLEFPCIVKEINGFWKIHVSDVPLEEGGFKITNGLDKLNTSESGVDIQSGVLIRSFNARITSNISTSNFNVPGTGLILNITKQVTVPEQPKRMTYKIFGVDIFGDIELASETVDGNNVKNYSAPLTMKEYMETVYLRITGYGETSGGIYH